MICFIGKLKMVICSVFLGLSFGICAFSMADERTLYGDGYYCVKDVACGTVTFDNNIQCPSYCQGGSMSAKINTCLASYYSKSCVRTDEGKTFLACAGKCTDSEDPCTLKLVECKGPGEREVAPVE